MVWIDHFEGRAAVTCLSDWTLRAWGPSDAAELFVGLSGLAVGQATARRLDREGAWRTQRQALARTMRVYIGYLLAAIATLGWSWWIAARDDAGPAGGPGAGNLLTAWLDAALLRRVPPELAILVLYLQLLPLAPLLVALLRRSLLAGLSLSCLVYAITQWADRAGVLEHTAAGGRYFRFGGWQWLFVLGLTAGLRWQQHSEPVTPRTRRWLTAGALLIVSAGWWLRPDVTGASHAWLDALPRDARNVVISLLSKPALGPLRLLHAVAVGGVLAGLLPQRWSLRLPAILRPMADCGRHSLLVYTAGVVLVPVAVELLERVGNAPWTVLLIELDAAVILLGLARWWDRRRTGGRVSVESPPPPLAATS